MGERAKWACSRCETFGTMDAGDSPFCDCDETEERLRKDLDVALADRDSLRAKLAIIEPVYEAAIAWRRDLPDSEWHAAEVRMLIAAVDAALAERSKP